VLGRADALQDKVDSLRKQVDDQSDVNGELALQVSDLKDKLNQSSLRHFKYKSQHQDCSARIGKLEQQVSEKELQRLHADGSRQSYERLAASRLASLGQLRSEMRGLQDQVSKLNEQCFTAKGKFFKAEKAKAEAERKLHKQGGMLEIEQQRASSQRNRIEELNSQVRMLTDQVAASRHETDQLKLNHTAELNNLIAGHVLDVSELLESEAQLCRIAHADQFDELDRENSEFRNQLEDEIQFLHVEKEEVDLLAHKQSELLDKLLDDKEALIKERDELILLCQESTAAVDERRESFEL
jgi:chromosome segregation ATPase